MSRQALRLWPLVAGLVSVVFVGMASETLRYGWIPGRLLRAAAAPGVVAVISWALLSGKHRAISCYLIRLSGAIVLCAVTHAVAVALIAMYGYEWLRFHKAFALFMLLTPWIGSAILGASEWRRHGAAIWIGLVSGLSIGAIAGICYAPWFWVAVLDELGLTYPASVQPRYIGYGNRYGIADLQVVVAVASMSGSFAITRLRDAGSALMCEADQRDHVAKRVGNRGSEGGQPGPTTRKTG